jgi:hypothetical protein
MQAKTLAAFVSCTLLTIGCSRGTQQAADDHAAKTESATSQTPSAGISIPGMKAGSMPAACYLRAVIDGKKWEATEMTPDRSHSSIIPVNGKNGGSSITFVIGGMRDNIGKQSNLSDSNQISYWGGEGFFVGAKSGQYTVTKMDDQFIEGTFNFTAEKDGKKVTCTNGEFRIPSPLPATLTD